MAKVYQKVGSQPIQRIIARTQTAQRAIDDEAQEIGLEAQRILDVESDVRTGTSFIELDKGKIDSYVVLNDTRGLQAAMTIEFGRKGGNLDRNGKRVTPSKAVAPLRKALGGRLGPA